MSADNGGEVTLGDEAWFLYPVFDDTDKKRLKRTYQDVVHETTETRGWPGFPEGGVAIAGNGGGDLPNDGGDALREAVFVFDHETTELTVVAEGLPVVPPD